MRSSLPISFRSLLTFLPFSKAHLVAMELEVIVHQGNVTTCYIVFTAWDYGHLSYLMKNST